MPKGGTRVIGITMLCIEQVHTGPYCIGAGSHWAILYWGRFTLGHIVLGQVSHWAILYWGRYTLGHIVLGQVHTGPYCIGAGTHWAIL